MPRFYCPTALLSGTALELPASAARHVQVLRLQPGDTITLFNGGPDMTGPGGEFEASIEHMGRSSVQVRVGMHLPLEREAAFAIHLAVGMPANDRMDWLVEKATELGVASIQPLMTELSVLRLSGERAEKKLAHWQSVAISACEQCGGNRVPLIHPVTSFASWPKTWPVLPTTLPLLLSLREGAIGLRESVNRLAQPAGSITFLSGPEGGLSSAEEDAAIRNGFQPVTLGPRVLRAETAALAALAALLT